MLPAVRRYLSACDFFAFDCEMTGLFLDGHNENYLDDMQDRRVAVEMWRLRRLGCGWGVVDGHVLVARTGRQSSYASRLW